MLVGKLVELENEKDNQIVLLVGWGAVVGK